MVVVVTCEEKKEKKNVAPYLRTKGNPYEIIYIKIYIVAPTYDHGGGDDDDDGCLCIKAIFCRLFGTPLKYFVCFLMVSDLKV